MAVECPYCGHDNFKDEETLRKHVEGFHKKPPGSRKTFLDTTCAKCGVNFTSKSDLLRHMQSEHKDPPLLLVNHNPTIKHMPTNNSAIKRNLDSDDDNNLHIPRKKIKINPLSDSSSDDEMFDSEPVNPSSEHDEAVHDKPKSWRKRLADGEFDMPKKVRQLKPRQDSKQSKWIQRYLRAKQEVKDCQNDKRKLEYELQKIKANHKNCEAEIRHQHERLAQCESKILSLDRERNELQVKLNEALNQIKDLEDNRVQSNDDMAKAIFNCLTIEEIERVRKLFHDNAYHEIREEVNIKVLQRIAQGLNRGYIPICSPQANKMTSAQEVLLESMDKATIPKMKKIVSRNSVTLADLMNTVDDSIRLVVELYRKFGDGI